MLLLLSLAIDIATVGAGTAEQRYCVPPGDTGEWFLRGATFVPATAVSANATNYTTISLKNGSTTLGTISTATTAFVLGTPRPFTLGGGVAREFTGMTDVLTIDKAESGTGGILDGCIVLLWERVR